MALCKVRKNRIAYSPFIGPPRSARCWLGRKAARRGRRWRPRDRLRPSPAPARLPASAFSICLALTLREVFSQQWPAPITAVAAAPSDPLVWLGGEWKGVAGIDLRL